MFARVFTEFVFAELLQFSNEYVWTMVSLLASIFWCVWLSWPLNSCHLKSDSMKTDYALLLPTTLCASVKRTYTGKWSCFHIHHCIGILQKPQPLPQKSSLWNHFDLYYTRCSSLSTDMNVLQKPGSWPHRENVYNAIY